MSASFLLTPEAEADLLSIWRYIAEDDSEAAADRVIRRMYSACHKLAEMPGMGHWREDLLDRRFKFWNAWSYLIVYRWESVPLEVISIVHGARDLDAFFSRRQMD